MSVAAFLAPHISILKTLAPIQVIINTNESSLLKQRGIDAEIGHVPIVRPISPWADIKTLWALFWHEQSQPAAVHSITPKAGLPSMAYA